MSTATATVPTAVPVAAQQPTSLVFVPPHTEPGWGRHHRHLYDTQNFWAAYRGNLWTGEVVNQLGSKPPQTTVVNAFSRSHGALQYFFRPAQSGTYLITAEWRTLSASRRGNGAGISNQVLFEAPGRIERRTAVPGGVERFGVRAYLRAGQSHRIRLGSEITIFLRYLTGSLSGYGEVIGKLERLAVYEVGTVASPQEDAAGAEASPLALVAELTSEIPPEAVPQMADESAPQIDEEGVSWEELLEMREAGTD